MKRFFLVVTCVCIACCAVAKNATKYVVKVTASVSLDTDVDYHITDATPFSTTGSVNIVNTDHAVVILDNVRPSAAEAYLPYIKVNGEPAVKDGNCQVRIYNRGSIIYPYPKDFLPLTMFTETKQQGESCNDYTLGSDNGFMKTLTDEQLNNAAKSIRLKRGYMVTLSTFAGGRGYSRCFIAHDADLEVNLPLILSERASSYRLFEWNDVSKQGWGGSQVDINTDLNTTWCYDWGAAGHSWSDREYVSHHHHEGWPGIDEVGRNGTSAHALGNNEPDNTNDPAEQSRSVNEVLATWEEMMRTGKRLGSPAMAGNTGWISQFIDSIDARGWRCDFVAVHAYWYSSRGDWEWLLGEYHNNYGHGRPLWITEMNYGAGWTGWPGANRDGTPENFQIELNGFSPILDFLSGCEYIERYAPFNLWEDCYKFHFNGERTPIGEYYSKMNPGLAYKGQNEKIPSLPRCRRPAGLRVNQLNNNEQGSIRLLWSDYNGEYNRSMMVQRKDGATGSWKTIASIPCKEQTSFYTYFDTPEAPGSYAYRIACLPIAGTVLYSNEVNIDIEPTGVTLPENESTDAKKSVYTLNGTAVPDNQARNMPEGVYIVNGKKVMVK